METALRAEIKAGQAVNGCRRLAHSSTVGGFPMPLSHRATFVSLDGLDGSGKSSQLARLAERLRAEGRTVTTCVDPGGTDLGAKVREILLFGRQTAMSLRAEALLFMASRAELVERVIAPAISRGEVVLSDRYLLANVVYQGHAGGLDPAELWQLGAFSINGRAPHLTLVLDVPVAVARSRQQGRRDRMESRDDWYFQRVRDGFLLEARRRPELHRVIDATASPDAVHEAIWTAAGGK
jgi:dTMP kinase